MLVFVWNFLSRERWFIDVDKYTHITKEVSGNEICLSVFDHFVGLVL